MIARRLRAALGTAALIPALAAGAIALASSAGAQIIEQNESDLKPCGTYDASVLEPRPIPETLGGQAALDAMVKEGFKFPATSLGAPEEIPASWYFDVKITPEQAKKICEKKLTAVFLDWSGAPLDLALRSGIKNVLSSLGIRLIRIADYSFDPNGMAGTLNALLPLHPDILITGGTVNPAQYAAILKPAIDQNITIVSWALGSPSLKIGQDAPIKAMVAMDFFQLGANMADGAHAVWPDGANFGYIHWINDVPPIQARETGMLERLKQYPNIKIVTEGEISPKETKSGYNNPSNATAFTQAFLTKHPEVNVLFAPWEDPPALGEAAAIKALGLQDKVKIVTEDLANQGAYQLRNNGIIAVDIVEGIYDGGRLLAMTAALSAIGENKNPYVMVPTFPVTSKTNIKQAWEFMLGPEVPCPASDCGE
jgi:ribose transport system substrate-binding protein